MSREQKKRYLQSREYKAKAKSIRKRQNYKCASCHKKAKLEVHHLSYKNLGNEPLKDLVGLCRECHQRQHDFYGYKRETNYKKIV